MSFVRIVARDWLLQLQIIRGHWTCLRMQPSSISPDSLKSYIFLDINLNFVISDIEYKTRWKLQPGKSFDQLEIFGPGLGGGSQAKWSTTKNLLTICLSPVLYFPPYCLFIFCQMQSTQTFIAPLELNFCQLWNLQSAHSYIYSFHFFFCCVCKVWKVYIYQKKKWW